MLYPWHYWSCTSGVHVSPSCTVLSAACLCRLYVHYKILRSADCGLRTADCAFRGLFEKLRKVTIGFFRPSVRLSAGTTRLPVDGFSLSLMFWGFFEMLSIKLKFHSDNNKGNFRWRPIHSFCHNQARFLLEWKMFQTNVVEEVKTHFVFSNFFSSENRAFYEITWEIL